MGQYYLPVIQNDVYGTVISDRSVDGRWTGAKLTEHSYMEVDLMEIIGYMIYKTPTKIAWVGDYADDEDLQSVGVTLSKRDIWGRPDEEMTQFQDRPIKELINYLLVNHTTKEYIDLKDYVRRYRIVTGDTDDNSLCPISILTAVGNGNGGGDYEGTCMEMVGKWTWHDLSLEDDTTDLKDYKERRDIIFAEYWQLLEGITIDDFEERILNI